ncbi:MAG TPA: hypothetical protein PLV89_12910, partial [Treponemataceae bacterium]|nr:hypothetical protein [Treponemataceae bacterium]
GPLLFCAESIDNGNILGAVILDPEEAISAEKAVIDGCESLVLKTNAFRDKPFAEGELYSQTAPEREKITLTAIPYHQWGNRGECEMRVWMRTV